MSKKITLTVDIQAQLNNFQSDLAKMQQMFDKLKMPNQAGFNASLKELQDRYKHIIEMTEGNKIDLVDEKKVEAEFNAIQKGYNNLISRIQRSSDKISLIDTKKTDILKSTFNDLKDSIKAVTKDNVIDSNLKQALDTVKALEAETEKLQKAFTNASTALEPQKNHIDSLKKKQEELSKSLDENREKLNQATFNKKGQQMENPMLSANYRKVLADVGPEIEKLERGLDAVNQELKEIEDSEAFQKLNKNYEKAAKNLETNKGKFTALEEAKKAAETYKSVLTDIEVSNAIDKLKATGIDFGIDLDSIKSVEDFKDAIKSFESIDVSDKNKVVQELVGNMENLKEKTNSVGEATNKATEDAKEFDKTLEGFKDKAKYFFGIENAINLLKRAVRSAFNTVKELDEVMTETAVVTNFDVGDMWDQLPQYTQRANELGVSIHDAYKAATLYYQQGLKTNEVMAVSNETLKMARIANLDAADATSRMTNALRGFNMEINETNAQRVNDVYSELAAITASDTKEISTAMTKVASLAHNANMEFETTSAFLAQMIETTRESAETAGTALKTVIARFSEVKKLYNQGDLMGTDEEGQEIDVNKVSQALRSAGINMNEYLTGAKGLDDIFLELASKWDSLDMIQQRYIATMAAGSRQQSRFIAMMSDYKRTTELVVAANNSAGASQRQFNKTLESFQSKLEKLKNSWDTFLMGIADNEVIKGAIDLLTGLLDSINKLTEKIDGIPGSLARIGIAVAGMKIGKEISAQFLGHLLEMKNNAAKIADGTGKTFVQRLGSWFKKGPDLLKKASNLIVPLESETKKLAESTVILTFARKNELSAIETENLARAINNGLIDKEILKTGQLTSEQLASIKATKMQTLATLGSVAVIGLLVGGIAFLAYSLYKFDQALDPIKSAKKTMEELEETTDNAAKAANEASESYNDFKDSLSSIDEKYEALNNMTRGTQEWKDAVSELNEEVLKLQESNEDLLIESEKGILKITNAKEIQDKVYQSKINAQSASIAAQKAYNQSQIDYNKAKLSKEYIEGSPLETLFSSFDGDWYELEKALAGELEVSEDFKDALEEYKKSIEIAKDETEAYDKTLKALIVSNANLQEGTETESAAYMNANRMESYYISAYNKTFDDNLTINQMKQQIAELSGYKTYGDYEKENGAISDDAARSMLAQIKATNNATKALDLFSKNLNRNSTFIKQLYSREDFAGLSKQQFEARLGAINVWDVSTEEQKRSKITKEFSNDIKLMWENLGEGQSAYGSYEAFFEDMVRDILKGGDAGALGFKQAAEKFKIYGIDFQNTLNNLSAGTQVDLAKNLDKIFAVTGTEGLNKVKESLDKIFGESSFTDNPEKLEEFIKAIDAFDWDNLSDLKGIEELADQFNVSETALKEFSDQLIECGKAANKVNLEKITKQFNELGSVIQSIREGKFSKTGLSQDFVDAATAYGVEGSKFIKGFDEKYTFTGTTKEITDAFERGVQKIIENYPTVLKNQDAYNKAISEEESKGRFGESYYEKLNLLYGYVAHGGTGVNKESIDAALSAGEKNGAGLVEELIDAMKVASNNQEEFNRLVLSLQNSRTVRDLADSSLSDNGYIGEASKAALQNEVVNYLPTDVYERNLGDEDSLADLYYIFKEVEASGIDIEDLESHMRTFQEEAEDAGESLSEVLATQTALANAKMVKNMKQLAKTYEEWSKYLDEDGKLMTHLDADSQKVVDDMKLSLKEMLNVADDIPDSFFQISENNDLIADTIKGVDGALNKLRTAVLKEQLKVKLGVDFEEAYPEVMSLCNWIESLDPNMKVNTAMDIGPILTAYNEMLASGKFTADEIKNYFKGLGVSFDITYEKRKAVVPTGLAEGSGNGLHWEEKDILVPKIQARWIGSKPIDYTPPKTNDGGGGSGSGKEEKPDYWENPFDELYNLQEKINESIRTREALERKYQKTVKLTASRLGEVTKAYADQIKQLRAEADLEKQMQEGRARQLNNVQNEIYTDSEGNRATFASLGVTKYASYDQATGLLQIDWSGLEEIAKDPNRTKEGEAAEAYIKRLEELQTQFEEVRDKLWDIEDKIEELREEAIDNYLTFEDRVMEALVNSYQQEIDDFKELSDTIKSTTDDVIKNIQEDVALARQIRDNTKKEEDIAEMEARLAYLRRDTSGANDLEIKQLEEELNQARQDYSDDLIDQQIQQMQDEAEKAAEQREHQIELMQHSLDMAIKNGDLWEEVYGLIDSSVNEDGSIKADSELMKLLKEGESFQSLSLIGQKKWMDEVAQAIKEALVGLGEAEDKWNIGDNDRRTGVSLDTFVERLYKEVLGRDADEAGKKYWVEQLQSGKLSRADVLKSFLGSEEFSKKNMGDEDFVETLYKTFFGRASDAEGKSYWTGQLKSGAKTRDDLINEFLKSTEWINSFMPKPGAGTKKPIGGGTSWADDGEKLPTMLDRKESENLVVLKDILGNLLNVSGGDAVKSNGDTYFDIHIDAEIGSDYDVDQLAERIKKQIYDTSAYRNANVINYIR